MKRKAILFAAILITLVFIALPIGLYSYNCNSNLMPTLQNTNSLTLFSNIFFNNVGFCMLMLLGSVSLNITTAGILFYSGYTWGIQLAILEYKYGIDFVLDTVTYHLPIEFIWIALIVYMSSIFSITFYNTCNNIIKIEDSIQIIKSQKNNAFIIFSLVLVSAIVEAFLPSIII